MSSSSYLDRVLEKIRRGSIPLGTVINLRDPLVTEIAASAGLDFVWIDLEHSSMGNAEVDGHIVAARGRAIAPFVRVPWNDPVRVKPILEMGPAAMIFPFVNSAEEARAAVAACRYPPEGIRGFCPHRAIDFGAQPLEEYLDAARREPWVVVQIEDADAVAQIDEICAVPGVGSLLVGPFDLTMSLGKAGRMQDPEVVALLDRVGEAARRHDIPLGAFSLSGDEEGIAAWIRRGASWLALDMEYAHITRGVQRSIETVERLRRG
jgi:2-keto-3-deoxy-L-rhamnonate aldolase RhmA